MSQDKIDPLDPGAGDDAAAGTDAESGERIAKRLARAGVCSRRDAERWIAEGRVSVNGRRLDSPAVLVRPGDRISVDGTAIPEPEPTRVWRYHKPAGLVTTARDEKGRPTVFERLPPDLPRVVSVGRLDLSSEGLLLLTNDGALARHLELPSNAWLRRYRVRVHGVPTAEQLHRLADGIFIDGVEYGPIEAELDRSIGANSWLTVGLREGKNREVRRVMEHLGLPVSRLIRIAYGPFQLGKLDRGGVEEIPRRVLRDQLPAFFPKDEPRSPAPAGGGPRLRYDRLPKALAAAAPSSATKGAAGKETREPKPAAPSARTARLTAERLLDGGARRGTDRRPQRPAAAPPVTEQPAAPPRGRKPLTPAQARAEALARSMDAALDRLGRDGDADEQGGKRSPSKRPRPAGGLKQAAPKGPEAKRAGTKRTGPKATGAKAAGPQTAGPKREARTTDAPAGAGRKPGGRTARPGSSTSRGGPGQGASAGGPRGGKGADRRR
ncbi:pseudouridine synthase [Oleisolibacter albus]|uniref:pseudouridine synthase n=1 Tax=Oleisolibacter albus TaxID=2171757 RepID=UPI0019619502